jgi:uncharacterized protein YbaR (Trm112 family)
MPLSEELLEVLACPACKGKLEYDRVNDWLTCYACGLRYRVRDDIADMLIENAERIGPEPRPR